MSKTYFGLDVHKKFTQVAVMEENGEVVRNEKVENNLPAFQEIFKEYSGHKALVMEAGYNWYYLMDLLEDEVEEVHLAHPLKTRAIAEAKIKTDKVDAATLAHLLRADLVPESYIPPRDIRDVRERLRYRFALVRIRTSIKMRVHNVLDKNGIKIDAADIFGINGREQLAKLNLRYPYSRHLYGWLKHVDQLGAEINQLDQEFKKLAKENAIVTLLKTIPGVGDTIGLLLYYEIGDISRFRNAGKLCSLGGLVPQIHQSGSSLWHGHITKQGNRWIRWGMVEAAQACVRCEGHRMRRYFNKLAKKHGTKTATVALARKLLTVAYHIWKENVTFKKYELIEGGHPLKISRAV